MAEDHKSPFHNPFAVLKPLRGDAPAEPLPVAAPAAAPKTPSSGRVIPRAVVRLERTGRGGKEVTVIDHLNLTAAQRAAWLKAFKAALGCGGIIEEDRLVLQGDQRERLPPLLTERGVRKVTVS